MTVYESILQKLLALCEPLIPGGVYRTREAALARQEGPGLVIRPETSEAERKARVFTMRDFIVSFELIVRGQVPDSDADPYLGKIHAALMADLTLGGAVAGIEEESTTWDFELADLNAVSVKLRYRFRFGAPTSTLAATA